eukprot:1825686-Prymnesium_polylepis.1
MLQSCFSSEKSGVTSETRSSLVLPSLIKELPVKIMRRSDQKKETKAATLSTAYKEALSRMGHMANEKLKRKGTSTDSTINTSSESILYTTA